MVIWDEMQWCRQASDIKGVKDETTSYNIHGVQIARPHFMHVQEGFLPCWRIFVDRCRNIPLRCLKWFCKTVLRV